MNKNVANSDPPAESKYIDGFENTLKNVRRYEEKRKEARRRNLPSYIWLVTKDIFSLLVILGIFNFASSSFETALFSLLVLIYLSVEGFFSTFGYKTMQTNFALANELLQIKQLLKYEENETEKGKQEKAAEAFSKLETHVQIHSMFLFLFFVIALWNLVVALIP